MLGFNINSSTYNDKILGVPSSVLLECGLEQSDILPVGQLNLINDEGYS